MPPSHEEALLAALSFLRRHAVDSTVLSPLWSRHLSAVSHGGGDRFNASFGQLLTYKSGHDAVGSGPLSVAHLACWTTAEFMIGLARVAQLASSAHTTACESCTSTTQETCKDCPCHKKWAFLDLTATQANELGTRIERQFMMAFCSKSNTDWLEAIACSETDMRPVPLNYFREVGHLLKGVLLVLFGSSLLLATSTSTSTTNSGPGYSKGSQELLPLLAKALSALRPGDLFPWCYHSQTHAASTWLVESRERYYAAWGGARAQQADDGLVGNPSGPIRRHEEPSDPLGPMKSHEEPSGPIRTHQDPTDILGLSRSSDPSGPISAHQEPSGPIGRHEEPSDPLGQSGADICKALIFCTAADALGIKLHLDLPFIQWVAMGRIQDYKQGRHSCERMAGVAAGTAARTAAAGTAIGTAVRAAAGTAAGAAAGTAAGTAAGAAAAGTGTGTAGRAAVGTAAGTTAGAAAAGAGTGTGTGTAGRAAVGTAAGTAAGAAAGTAAAAAATTAGAAATTAAGTAAGAAATTAGGAAAGTAAGCYHGKYAKDRLPQQNEPNTAQESVTQLASHLRVHPKEMEQWEEAAYLATHVIYSHSMYGRRSLVAEGLHSRVDSTSLDQLATFILSQLPVSLELQNADVTAEFLDCIQLLGLPPRSPPPIPSERAVQSGVDTQKAVQSGADLQKAVHNGVHPQNTVQGGGDIQKAVHSSVDPQEAVHNSGSPDGILDYIRLALDFFRQAQGHDGGWQSERSSWWKSYHETLTAMWGLLSHFQSWAGDGRA